MKKDLNMVEEVYCLGAVNILTKQGYKIQHIYNKKEYIYSHDLGYQTLQDAYTAYVMVIDESKIDIGER